MTKNVPLCVFLSRFAFTAFAVYLQSPLCQRTVANFPGGITCWIKIRWYFSSFIIPSALTSSPTPLAEMHPLIMTELPPRFAAGCRHSLSLLTTSTKKVKLIFSPVLVQFGIPQPFSLSLPEEWLLYSQPLHEKILDEVSVNCRQIN